MNNVELPPFRTKKNPCIFSFSFFLEDVPSFELSPLNEKRIDLFPSRIYII